MNVGELLLLYGIVGIACGVAIWMRGNHSGRSAWTALVAVPLWPLWAPVVLTSAREQEGPRQGDPTEHRVQLALRESASAAESSPFAALLSVPAVEKLGASLSRIAHRNAELTRLLRQPELDIAAARERYEALMKSNASVRAQETARLHFTNLERLHRLRDSDANALDELADLLGTLRTQLLLAGFADSPVEGVDSIVSEVWARVEGLSAALREA